MGILGKCPGMPGKFLGRFPGNARAFAFPARFSPIFTLYYINIQYIPFIYSLDLDWGSRCSPSPARKTTCAIFAESKSLPDRPPGISLSKEVSAGYQHGNKGNTRVRREGASDCLGNVRQDPFRDKAGISTNFSESTTLLPHHSMLLMYGHQDHEDRVLEVEARSARGSEEIRASTHVCLSAHQVPQVTCTPCTSVIARKILRYLI